MIKTIEHEGYLYPAFTAEGNAAQFAIPYAQKVCQGFGYDIGCKHPEWALPGAMPIDLDFNDNYDAMNLPEKDPDYIFSSHCLEHIPDWVGAMEYWCKRLKKGGTLFLYLPDYCQTYWRPWNNRKHIHVMDRTVIGDYMKDRYKNVFMSGTDLNFSFMVMGEKI